MKKNLFVLLPLILLSGCGEDGSSSSVIDYGTVEFSNVKVYDNGYGKVKIQPIFSNPDACKDLTFTYEVEDESVVSVDEEGYLEFLDTGSSKVKAYNEHFGEQTFYVDALNDFGRKGSDVIGKMKNTGKDVNYVNADTTLFIGDSFFEFWKNGNNGVTRFQQEFENYDVYNMGISATHSHDWRSLVEPVFSLMECPKNIVVNIGINNVDDLYETGLNCANGVKSLLLDLMDTFPEANIYYFSITRCTNVFASNWTNHNLSNSKVKEFITLYEKLHYLDVMELYGEDYATCLADGLHPNQKGYNYFKQLILENIEMVEL